MYSKILSIYYPQYHIIPENEEWWGKGFTEWTNVKRGRSFYPGHYQPREPLDDNYYDLSDLKVLEKHTRMAKRAGISGFCFYHYYFCGKKLLEKPIENYKDKSNEKFPYCLIWANQSWERTWYRTSKDILLEQHYGEKEDWERHFYYLLDFFKDERYIKIDDKPVYIIYMPQDIPCKGQLFATWRKLARENGFKGLYLIAMDTFYGRDKHKSYYSAYMDFEPVSSFRYETSWRKRLMLWKQNHINNVETERTKLQNMIWAKNIFSYSYLCRSIEKKARRNIYKTFPGVFAGWDNTPRQDEAGTIVGGSSPQKFQKHITKMLHIAEKNKKEYVFLNAWNEWSEGAYVEPDKKYGYAYLRALRNAVDEYKKGEPI